MKRFTGEARGCEDDAQVIPKMVNKKVSHAHHTAKVSAGFNVGAGIML